MSNNRERQGGIVPGFANSKTAFTIIEHVDENVIHVIYSKQFENSSTEKMVSHTWNLIKQFKLNDKATSFFLFFIFYFFGFLGLVIVIICLLSL